MKLLIISYYFPPIGGTSVQRTVRFIKKLSKLGYSIHVFSAKKGKWLIQDDTLKNELPKSIKIHRKKHLDIPGYFNSYNFSSSIREKRIKLFNNSCSLKYKFLRKYNGFLKNHILKPDDKIFWARSFIKYGVKVIKRNNIDIIYATGPPFSNFMLGLWLKNKTKKPFIIDFRDGWTEYTMKGRINKYDFKLERDIVINANMVIFNTNWLKNKYKSKYLRILDNKSYLIRNSFDDKILSIKPINRRDKKFIISYTGVFSESMNFNKKERTPYFLFNALNNLIEKNKISENEIQFQYIGPINNSLSYLVKKYNLYNIVDIIGPKSHNETLQYQKAADCLFLMIYDRENSDGHIPGKLYEYLATRKPILATIPNSNECKKIIEESRSGIVIPVDNIKLIEQGILDIMKKRFIVDKNYDISKYSAYYQTTSLINIFDNVFYKH